MSLTKHSSDWIEIGLPGLIADKLIKLDMTWNQAENVLINEFDLPKNSKFGFIVGRLCQNKISKESVGMYIGLCRLDSTKFSQSMILNTYFRLLEKLNFQLCLNKGSISSQIFRTKIKIGFYDLLYDTYSKYNNFVSLKIVNGGIDELELVKNNSGLRNWVKSTQKSSLSMFVNFGSGDSRDCDKLKLTKTQNDFKALVKSSVIWAYSDVNFTDDNECFIHLTNGEPLPEKHSTDKPNLGSIDLEFNFGINGN